MNRLLLRLLQKDILQVKNTVHCLSNELKVHFHDRNFFILMFQLRSQLTTLQTRIYSFRVDILSILDQVSEISSQKLKPTLLSPSDLKLLLAKLEDQLLLHPHLTLPLWKRENVWYMYKFMKLQTFMFLDTLYVVLHIPLVNILLQFTLHRIHNIPLVYPVIKKSFRYPIQKSTLHLGQIHSTLHSP